MEEEAVSVKLRKSLQSSKEYVSKGYHSFADYINKTYTAHKEKGHTKTLKMAFAKYVLIFLNIFYMITSLTLINIGTIGQIIHNNSYFWIGLDMLSIYWIATGVILLCASIFGMIGAFKESIIWTNIFGVLMTIVFVIQISSAIVSFQFIGKSQSIAWYGINNLMSSYSYGQYQQQMDWIQENFQCCGNDGPSDWNKIGKFERRSNNYNSHNYYYQSTTTTLSTPLLDRMPASCCKDGSNYNNLTCDTYYQSGCCNHIREVISESVMIIGSVALAVAVLEILGIVFAFVVAKIMRKTKSFIAIQHYDALTNLPNNSEAPSAKAVENVGEDVETI